MSSWGAILKNISIIVPVRTCMACRCNGSDQLNTQVEHITNEWKNENGFEITCMSWRAKVFRKLRKFKSHVL